MIFCGEKMVYVIGIFSGFLSGFFGAGGGLLLLPALIRILKMDEIKARGTTLASILVAVLTSSMIYTRTQTVDFKVICPIALGGVMGAIIGAKLVNKLPKTLLSFLFDLFLLYTSWKMIFSG